MKKLFVGLLFGSVAFLANAEVYWHTVDDNPRFRIEIDRNSQSQYKGQIIGGGNPENYAAVFVRFTHKPGTKEYESGDISATYQYISDCNSNMSTTKSVLYRGIDNDFIRTTTFIEVLNQNDFNTPYPNTVNQRVTSLICYVNSKANEKSS